MEDLDEAVPQPESGDWVTCYWCGQEFEFAWPARDHVAEGMYWCGCSKKLWMKPGKQSGKQTRR